MPPDSPGGGRQSVEIGFDGGQVLATRLRADGLEHLRTQLASGSGWQDIETDDGTLAVDLTKVIFIRVADNEAKVGF